MIVQDPMAEVFEGLLLVSEIVSGVYDLPLQVLTPQLQI